MKSPFSLSLVALLIGSSLPLRAADTPKDEVAGVNDAAEGATDDFFQGATPTAWSPVFGTGEEGRLEEVKEMFGNFVAEPPSQGATVFVPNPSDPVFMVEFQTASPVSFSTVRVILEEDRKGETKGDRSVEKVRLFGRPDAGSFAEEQQLFEVEVNEDYQGTYASPRVQLTVTGVSASDLQYFRIEFVGLQNQAGTGFAGPRVTEVDALAK